MPPTRFVPLAEKTGLIGRLTDWVLSEALEAQVRWRSVGINVPVGVNFSPTTINTPDLPDRGLRTACPTAPTCKLVDHRSDGTSAIDLLQAGQFFFHPLHDAGIRTPIDDFGKRATPPLRHCPDLPLDELKVDQSFVMRSLTSTADDAIVRTVRELVLLASVLTLSRKASKRRHMFDRMSGYGLTSSRVIFFQGPLRSQISLNQRAGERADSR